MREIEREREERINFVAVPNKHTDALTFYTEAAIKMIMGQCVFNFLMCSRYVYNNLIFARRARHLSIFGRVFFFRCYCCYYCFSWYFSSCYSFAILLLALHKFTNIFVPVFCLSAVVHILCQHISKFQPFSCPTYLTLSLCALLCLAMSSVCECTVFLCFSLLLILFMCSVYVEKINKWTWRVFQRQLTFHFSHHELFSRRF